MRTFMVVVLLAACGGGGGSGNSDAPVQAPDARQVDAREPDAPPDAPDGCDLLAQSGCGAGEKCAWVYDGAGGGAIACVPDGTLPVGAACTLTMGTAGYDDCAGGLHCLGKTCKTICELHGGAPACDANHLCRSRAGLFEVDGDEVAGVCDSLCDPLTQASSGGDAACGSVQSDAPTQGCYSNDDVVFACAPAGDLARTDRVAVASPFYVNSCAPGYTIAMYESTGSTTVVCSGLCAPHDADDTQPAYAAGDPTELVKLPGDLAPIAGHGTCTPGAKGSEAGEDCRYLWNYLYDGAGNPIASPYADTVGLCIANAHYLYDSDGDGVPDAPYPSCAALSPTDAAFYGCYKSTESLAPITATAMRLPLPRVDVLHRHRIE